MALSGALDERDALLDQLRALLGPISELQHATPPPADLGELAFAARWDLGRRERFAKASSRRSKQASTLTTRHRSPNSCA